jgi:hypothetical protein
LNFFNPQAWIIAIYSTISLVLALSLIVHQSNINQDLKSYFITFDDDLTVFDIDNGKLTITVDNNPDGTHILDIYGLSTSSNSPQAKISTSDLGNEAGMIIESQQIVFNPSVIQLRPLSTNPETVSLSIENSNQAGTFHGQIFLLIGQSLISVPIKASTAPLLAIAILWVLVGISAAIAFWELIRYLEKLKLNVQKNMVTQKLSATRLLCNQPPPVGATPAAMAAYAANKNKMEEEIQSDLRAAANIETKISSSEARLANINQTFRTLLIQIATSAVPTAIAVIALFNDPFVSNLQNIDELQRWILIGIGFGIGSANKIVDRG